MRIAGTGKTLFHFDGTIAFSLKIIWAIRFARLFTTAAQSMKPPVNPFDPNRQQATG